MRLAEQLQRIAAAPAGPQVGAFFDLDGTLVAGFTATSFLTDQVRRREVDWWSALRTAAAALDGTYLGGDPVRSGELTFRALAGRDESVLADLGERLFVDKIAATIRAEARELVNAHHERGHTVVVSSAATRYQVAPVARDLGIDDLVCTELETRDGVFTGNVVGRMRWGAGKAAGVREFARARDITLSASFGYGNGVEDIDFLATVGHPVPISPDRGLRDAARRFDWPVLDLANPAEGSLIGAARTLAALGAVQAAGISGVALGVITGDRQRGANASIDLGCQAVLAAAGVRLEVTGRGILDSSRPAIVVANHRSALDPIVMGAILRGDFTVVAKQEARFDPRAVLGAALLDPVYVDRSNSAQARAALEAVADRIRAGTSLLIFPEGTRTPTPRLGRFRKGAFHLAVQTGAPIVPVVLDGVADVLPRHATTVRPGLVRAAVLEPMRDWRLDTLDRDIATLRERFEQTLADWPTEGPRR